MAQLYRDASKGSKEGMRLDVQGMDSSYNLLTHKFGDASMEQRDAELLRGKRQREALTGDKRFSLDVAAGDSRLKLIKREGNSYALRPVQNPEELPAGCLRSSVGYNPLTGLEYKYKHLKVVKEDPLKVSPPAQQSRRVSKPAQKDFNVITNRYLEDHDLKDAIDRTIIKLRTTEKKMKAQK